MPAKVIEWDGTHVPEALKQLPPGRYVIESVEDLGELTPEEDAGIRAALDDLEAGHGIPYEEVMLAAPRSMGRPASTQSSLPSAS